MVDMTTNNEPGPNFEMSPPEQSGGEELTHDLGVEAPAPKEQHTHKPSALGTAAAPAAQPVVTPTVQSRVPVPTAPVAPVDPKSGTLPADDVDLIEKEWVDRAKAIVQKTANDPRRQKSEISKVKAEYIQKRFNKQIKVDEAA